MERPLDSARLKFNRGCEHLDALKGELEKAAIRFAQPEVPFVSLTGYFDRNANDWVVVLAAIATPPPSLALLVADAAVNFRAALDHLVWELAFVDLSGREPKRGRSGFPLVQRNGRSRSVCSGEFDQTRSTLLEGVTVRHRAMIKRHQPYIGGDLHPFALLADLTNDDKHRTVQPVFAAASEIEFTFPTILRDCVVTGPVHGFLHVNRPLHPGTELIRIPIRVTGPNPHVGVETEYSVYVALRNGFPVQDFLEEVSLTVSGVLDEFGPVFGTPKARRVWKPRDGRIQSRPPPAKGEFRIEESKSARRVMRL